MAEVCRDFGARLIRSWDREADKEEVTNFVKDATDAFFKKSVEKEIVSPVKPKAKKASKKKSEPEAEPEPEPEVVSDNEAEITVVESPKKKGKGKAKGKAKAPAKAKEVAKKTKASSSSGKPKCQATTAKGTPCSKCALEGEVFCNVHLKKVAAEASDKKATAPAKAKGKTKKAVAESPKHTHGLTSPPLKETCELCDTHGMPFEVPEYEEEIEKEKENDPDFKLTEDDFDESENEDGSDLEEAEFDELD